MEENNFTAKQYEALTGLYGTGFMFFTSLSIYSAVEGHSILAALTAVPAVVGLIGALISIVGRLELAIKSYIDKANQTTKQ